MKSIQTRPFVDTSSFEMTVAPSLNMDVSRLGQKVSICQLLDALEPNQLSSCIFNWLESTFKKSQYFNLNTFIRAILFLDSHEFTNDTLAELDNKLHDILYGKEETQDTNNDMYNTASNDLQLSIIKNDNGNNKDHEDKNDNVSMFDQLPVVLIMKVASLLNEEEIMFGFMQCNRSIFISLQSIHFVKICENQRQLVLNSQRMKYIEANSCDLYLFSKCDTFIIGYEFADFERLCDETVNVNYNNPSNMSKNNDVLSSDNFVSIYVPDQNVDSRSQEELKCIDYKNKHYHSNWYLSMLTSIKHLEIKFDFDDDSTQLNFQHLFPYNILLNRFVSQLESITFKSRDMPSINLYMKNFDKYCYNKGYNNVKILNNVTYNDCKKCIPLSNKSIKSLTFENHCRVAYRSTYIYKHDNDGHDNNDDDKKNQNNNPQILKIINHGLNIIGAVSKNGRPRIESLHIITGVADKNDSNFDYYLDYGDDNMWYGNHRGGNYRDGGGGRRRKKKHGDALIKNWFDSSVFVDVTGFDDGRGYFKYCQENFIKRLYFEFGHCCNYQGRTPISTLISISDTLDTIFIKNLFKIINVEKIFLMFNEKTIDKEFSDIVMIKNILEYFWDNRWKIINKRPKLKHLYVAFKFGNKIGKIFEWNENIGNKIKRQKGQDDRKTKNVINKMINETKKAYINFKRCSESAGINIFTNLNNDIQLVNSVLQVWDSHS